MTMRGCTLLLALAGCGGPAGADGTGETTGGGSSSSSSSSTGEVVDLCADVACGPGAGCEPHDGACYCEPGRHGDPDVGCAVHPDYCADAEALVGHGVCTHSVPDAETWLRLATDGTEEEGLRKLGKFLAPIDPASPLPTLFGDRQQYSLHLCMLMEAFPEVLPMFTHTDYLDLVYYRATRTMIAGSLYQLRRDDLEVDFVFTVEVPDDPNELLRAQEVFAVYRLVQDRFAVGALGFMPRSAAQQGVAIGWTDPGMPVIFNAGVQEPAPMQCQ